ncbi:MAG: DUF3829 domain-containing protein [Myxococcales bacterium]|nr:DUF3829 domain-containing protein [Myxococcales bacterium]
MARKTSSTTRLSLAALALSGALACDRGEQAGDPPVTKSESPAKPDKAAPPEADPLRDPELITNKLGPYAACINTTRPFVARHYRRYTDRVEGDGALKRGAKGPAPAALPEAALTPCEKALREGKHLSPPLPEVEAAAAEYDTRTREYAALASKASEAIAAKDKDAITSLHEDLVAAYDRWDNANLELTEALDALQEQADRDALARVEARAGKGLEYRARELVISSRGFAHCLASIDRASCSDALSSLQRAHTAYGEAAGDAAIPGVEALSAAAQTFVTAARAATESLAKDPESTDAVAAAFAGYNELVRASGGLDFSKAKPVTPAP